MNYLEALKIYNEGHNSWCSPRKGTPEYYMVRFIMNKNGKKSLSIKSSKTSSIVIPKNISILAYKNKSTSSSSVKLPKKRMQPLKKAKRLYIDSSTSSSSVKLPKKRMQPLKKAKRLYIDSSTSSSS